MMCKHEMWLINQGISWCELQKEEYFKHCKDCPHFEEAEICETDSTNNEEIEKHT